MLKTSKEIGNAEYFFRPALKSLFAGKPDWGGKRREFWSKPQQDILNIVVGRSEVHKRDFSCLASLQTVCGAINQVLTKKPKSVRGRVLAVDRFGGAAKLFTRLNVIVKKEEKKKGFDKTFVDHSCFQPSQIRENSSATKTMRNWNLHVLVISFFVEISTVGEMSAGGPRTFFKGLRLSRSSHFN